MSETKQIRRRKWSDKEKHEIMSLFQMGMNHSEIALIFRTTSSIIRSVEFRENKRLRNSNGLPLQGKYMKWSDYDHLLLKELVEKGTDYPQIAEILNRPIRTVVAMTSYERSVGRIKPKVRKVRTPKIQLDSNKTGNFRSLLPPDESPFSESPVGFNKFESIFWPTLVALVLVVLTIITVILLTTDKQ